MEEQLNSSSPVFFLWLLSLEYILVKGDDEDEERMSEEACASWDDDDVDWVMKESIFWEWKEQSLQMYPLVAEELDFDVSPLTPDLWSAQILLPEAEQHTQLNQFYWT